MRFRPHANVPLTLAAGLALFAAVSLAQAALAQTALTGLAPAEPQPAAGRLAPGLAVAYHFGIFNSIDGMIRRTGGAKSAKPGAPLKQLNFKTGFGPVLTSKRQDGVGAFITGYIRFDKPGAYVFRVQSNDGVKLAIGGRTVFSDPVVHADSFSDPIPVRIATAGWYPIEVIYFEKRNTSTLELYWKTPGQSGDFELVPAGAFGHSRE